MKRFRWLLILLALSVTVVIWSAMHLYHSYTAAAQAGLDQYGEKVLAKTPLTTIIRAMEYYGTEHYHVFFGTDDQERSYYVLINQDEHYVIPAGAGIAPEELRQKVEERFASMPVEIRHLVPGREDGQLLYEALVVDEKGRYYYLYYDYYTGEGLKEIRLSHPWFLDQKSS